MFQEIIALILGIVVGFGAAVPIGPVGLIVFQRTIAKSRLIGLATGLGAAVTDAFLASVGAFGIRGISDFILDNQGILRITGGTLLFIVGLFAVFSKAKPPTDKHDSAITVIEHFFSGLILTATNPLAAVSFFLAFAVIGPRFGIASHGMAPILVLGVFIGSCLWWLLLTYVSVVLGHKIRRDHIDLVNKWLGLVIAIIGGVMLVSGILR